MNGCSNMIRDWRIKNNEYNVLELSYDVYNKNHLLPSKQYKADPVITPLTFHSYHETPSTLDDGMTRPQALSSNNDPGDQC